MPSDGATNQPVNLTLSWGTVVNAATYAVQVATDPTFATTLYSQFNNAATTMALSSLSNSTTYYWRAGAKNAGGVSGWSNAWSFTTVIAAPTSSPTLALPSDGVTNLPLNLTLSWGTVVNAATYAVQVATDPTFATTLYSQWNNSATSMALSSLSNSTTYYWRAGAKNAGGVSGWSNSWSFTTANIIQTIAIDAGWNMKSLNVLPLDSTSVTVFGTDTTIFLLAKNMSGRIYSPYLGIAQITNVSTGQGYQVYCNVPDTLRVAGSAINVTMTPIPLAVGWNMIAYFPQTSDSVQFAFAGVEANITLVKNNSGAVYMPGFGLNSIGRMLPGEGYKALMAAAASFTYPTGTDKVAAGATKVVSLPGPRHYCMNLNTGNNATVVAKTVAIGGAIAADGDEVGAFDGLGNIVGVGTVVHGMTAFAVWGADPMAKKATGGLADGKGITFRLWTGAAEYPLDFASTAAPKYSADAVFMGDLAVPGADMIRKFDLSKVYPNPFRGSATIAFDVPLIVGVAEQDVEIGVYDMKGSLVRQIVKGKYAAGHYTVAWNDDFSRQDALGSNVYIVRMKADNFDKRMKLVRLK